MQEYAKIGDKELEATLKEHLRWLESDGCEGSRADFRNINLQFAQLNGVDLRQANLSYADLRAASLIGADLQGVDLFEARLEDADLSKANMRGVKHLSVNSLARACLMDTVLPRSLSQFDNIIVATDLVRIARPIFIAMIAGCFYTLLTIGTTSDVKLLTGSATSPLPIIQTNVPISSFYWVAPLVLLGIYLYLQIYLQRLWEILATSPAKFPDGRRLDQRITWMPAGLVRSYFLTLNTTRLHLSRIQNFLCSVLLWWIVPITLIPMLIRYLPKHDIIGTSVHTLLLVVSITLAITLQGNALETLRANVHKKRKKRALHVFGKLIFRISLLGFGLFIILFCYDMFNGKRPGLEEENPYFYADLRRANLEGADFRRANLYNANFSEARLNRADFKEADLRRANFRGAKLQFATFRYADVDNLTNLLLADVYGADLRWNSPLGISPWGLIDALNRNMALYNEYDRKLLGLPLAHNDNVIKTEPEAFRPE